MAVIVEVVLPGLTKEQYDTIRREVGWLDSAPVGGLSHVTWWEGPDCHNLDSWQDEAAFGAFGQERLGPALEKLGIQVEVNPTFHEAHEVFLPRPVTLTATSH
jgi:hypothetical protein